MPDQKEAARIRAARFKEAERMIEGSKQTVEQTNDLLHRADRLLRENPIVLHPDAESSAQDQDDDGGQGGNR